jgi:hypothetical protein
MTWALKFFDDWVIDKQSCAKVKVRGYKDGVIAEFFALKDSEFLSRTSSKINSESQGEKLQLVTLYLALRLSLTFVGLQEIGESSSSAGVRTSETQRLSSYFRQKRSASWCRKGQVHCPKYQSW